MRADENLDKKLEEIEAKGQTEAEKTDEEADLDEAYDADLLRDADDNTSYPIELLDDGDEDPSLEEQLEVEGMHIIGDDEVDE